MPALKLDVIHSNHPLLLGNAAADYAKKLDIPLVFTFHTRYDEYSHYIPLSQAFAREIIVEWLANYIEKCHFIITPSDSIRQMLADYAGITKNIATIPTGIDMEPFHQADGEGIREKNNWCEKMVLISIGRLAPEKNWVTLIKALKEVVVDHPDVCLVILGDGPSASDLKEMVKDLGLQGHVHFPGLVPFEEVPNCLKAADLFVFASVSETQGLVTMEAMAAGLPVVAVNAPGTRDIVIDGVDGLLTENDPSALAQAIKRLLDNGALFGRLKSATTRRAQEFDSQIQAQKMLEVYQQAIENKKSDQHVVVDKTLFRNPGTNLASQTQS